MRRRREAEEGENTTGKNKLKPVRCTDWRIVIGNWNTLPNANTTRQQYKWDKHLDIHKKYEPDILCGSEHNRIIHKLNRHEHPKERIGKMGDKTICRFSSIKGNFNSSYIEGGTGIVTYGKACTHTVTAEEDENGLGRWNLVTFQGKKERKVTIVSVYRPRNKQAAAEYQHQKTCVDRPGKVGLGQEALWFEDLKKLIGRLRRNRNEVIICGDFNSDLNDEEGEVNEFMQENGLRELLIERYGRGPATHINGSTTIDGVYATDGIKIRQGGYIDEETVPSDHKWLWIDISEKDFLYANRDDCMPSITRRATSKIPSVRNKFNQLLEEQVKKHKLLEKIRSVHEGGLEKGFLSEEEEKEYEAIEERIQRAVKYADKRCRKVRRGKIYFSKKVRQIMRDIRILKLLKTRMLKKRQRDRPKMRKLKRLMKKYKYKGRRNFESLQEINKELKSKEKEYTELKPSAKELYKKHLYELAMEKAEEDPKGKDPEWHMQQIERQMEIKEHFANIRKFEGKAGRQGVERVDIEVEEDVLMSVFGREEIAEHIRAANVEKRQQSRDTPLRQEPLQSLLGEQMDFETWEKILNCEIELPEDGIEEGTRLWYDFIRSQDTESFQIEWTTEEYCESWRKMDENKSSIPGIHTTHLKCLRPDMQAAEVISKLALVPLQTGYTPKTWKQGIDSMIPKKVEGECRPNKLRLILLFDARFNHNNKLIGRRMMEYAERKGILATEQYGSRKNKSAIEHAVNKRITLDTSRQQKATCVYIANDAKSCYDRILLMVAYLTMRTAGIDAKAALSSIKTLVEMEMNIKTAHGVTEIKYGGDDWDEWPHGIGQGNGYGPAIWALISSPLLKILRSRGHGMNIHSPITKESLRLAGFSFVDDTDQCEIDMQNIEWAEHLEKTQESLTLWECLLRTTGGAIEPTKSDWTKLKYKWVDGKAELEEMDETDTLIMRNPEGEEEPLKQYPVDKARETLGVWQASNGQEDTQKEKMIGKIQKWGNKINKSRIDGEETASASKITIGKTIRYPLAATTLNKEQAREIDKEFRWNALGKMKVVRTAPAILVAAPKEYGGLEVGNEVYINQMIDHCLIMLKHGHKTTPTGTLLRTTAELLAVEGGIGGDPLLFNVEEMTWLTERTWIGTSIQALRDNGLSIHTGMKGLTTWTTSDEFLMEEAQQYISGKELHIFNKVRMYLRVATWSDIVQADCKHIDTEILFGRRSQSPCMSQQAYTWPNVDRPTPSEILIWTKTLGLMYGVTGNNHRMPGEARIYFEDKDITNSQWVVSPNKEKIFRREERGWTQFDKCDEGNRRTGPRYTPENLVGEIPNGCKPITVKEDQGYMCLWNEGRTVPEEEEREQENWVLAHVDQTERDKEIFAQQIRDGEGIVVSDGSYKNGRSSAAFTTVPEKQIKGVTTIPGNKKDQSSYRGELGGILSAITYTNKVAKEKRITRGKCVAVCDNKGAVKAVFGGRDINPRWKCFDLLTLIRYQIEISPIRWEGKHVKGHQDDETPYDELPILAQANVDVDELAKEELRRQREINDQTRVEGQTWRLYDEKKNKWISGDIEKEIRRVVYEEHMQKWWSKKIGKEISEQEWEEFKRLNRLTSGKDHLFAIKHGASILGTKLNLVRRKHGDCPLCPCCEQEENTDHILQCQSAVQKGKIRDEIQDLEDEIQRVTPWEIREGIREVLLSLHEQREPVMEGNWSDETCEAVRKQYEKGQRAFALGIWCKEWEELQNDYQKRIKSRVQGRTIIVQIKKEVRKLVKEMWLNRNEQLHHKEDSEESKRKKAELDDRIRTIMATRQRTNSRVFTQIDKQILYKHNIGKLSRMKLKRKERWVKQAEDILSRFEQSMQIGEVRIMMGYFHVHRDDG